MANEENRRDQEQLQKFKDAMIKTLGDAIRRPMSARLGYQDSQGRILVKVPDERTDQPNRYYFHEAGGTAFQGEAWLQPGALLPWQIRYNAPIRVKKDALSGEWEIVGVDSRFAQQFFAGVTEEDENLYFYESLAPGLLIATTPPSMAARVLPGAYRVGSEVKYIETLNTVNWSQAPASSNVPTLAVRSRYVMVQVDFENQALSYKYGAEFPSGTSFRQVLAFDNNTGTYIPNPDPGHFMSGLIELKGGMTVIQRANIIPLQQYLTLASTDDAIVVLDNIVTWDAHVVIDSETGNVVYI